MKLLGQHYGLKTLINCGSGLGWGGDMAWVLIIVVSVGGVFLLRFVAALQMDLQSPKRVHLLRQPISIDDLSYRRRIHLAKPRPAPQEEEVCTTYSLSSSR